MRLTFHVKIKPRATKSTLYTAQYGNKVARTLGSGYELVHSLGDAKYDPKDIIANELGIRWAEELVKLDGDSNMASIEYYLNNTRIEIDGQSITVDQFFKAKIE